MGQSWGRVLSQTQTGRRESVESVEQKNAEIKGSNWLKKSDRDCSGARLRVEVEAEVAVTAEAPEQVL